MIENIILIFMVNLLHYDPNNRAWYLGIRWRIPKYQALFASIFYSVNYLLCSYSRLSILLFSVRVFKYITGSFNPSSVM